MQTIITKSLAAHEIASYPQQIPGICKLKFKISSAEVKSFETLHLFSKGNGKNNWSVLQEQRCLDTQLSKLNDRDAVWHDDGVHTRLTVLGDFNTHAEDAPDLTGAKSALITTVSSPSISHPKYTQVTIPCASLDSRLAQRSNTVLKFAQSFFRTGIWACPNCRQQGNKTKTISASSQIYSVWHTETLENSYCWGPAAVRLPGQDRLALHMWHSANLSVAPSDTHAGGDTASFLLTHMW